MMEATTDPAVQESVGKQMPRDISDDDIFKPKNQPTTETIIAEPHAEKTDLSKDDQPAEGSDDAERPDPEPEEEEASSDASSPEPTGPLQPLYSVLFTDEVTKSGDVICYRIQVTKTGPPQQSWRIERQFEDLEYLEQCLSGGGRSPGVILPPLPPRPVADPQQAEQRSRRQLGADTALVLGDDWQRDCRLMERYLRLLLRHEVLGRDPALESFLAAGEAPVRTLVRRSLLTRLQDGLTGSRATHPDCDEFFQRERVKLNEYEPALQRAAEAFSAVVFAQQRLSNQINHLATALNIGVGSNEGWNGLYHKLNVRFSGALQEYKRGVDLSTASADGTLGQTLELHARYVRSETDMLYRRTGLMMEYEAANRGLEKTKAQRRSAAEEAKQRAEEAFEECSDTAKSEIRALQRLRSTDILSDMAELARSQIHAAQILRAELGRHLDTIRQFTVPEPGQLRRRR
ncbi:sorting nexin-32-like [Amphibalanus amphitrite]|uniref:sorting nexin-32-like n=1 Tax=Amphibalanus amphitrite TaxID=1232801 RepID=UPI001C8FF6B1|nr:sorting nexin-32-like [Amphibalanus amphitrite]